MPNICAEFLAPGERCSREALPNQARCVFHFYSDELISPATRDYRHEFSLGLNALLNSRDGDWRCFVFPRDFDLTPVELDFPIRATAMRCKGVTFDKVIFKKPVQFDDSIFDGRFVLRGGHFHEDVSFERCKFKGHMEAHITEFHKVLSLQAAEFLEPVLLRGRTHGRANLNNCSFRSSAHFSGYRNTRITIGGPPTASRTEYFRLFEGGAELTYVDFAKPTQVLFTQVNLADVLLLGTNLRGARFVGANWWQPTLRRNGLRDEVQDRQIPKEPQERIEEARKLGETYRNIRTALEDNRNYDEASDFYIGEMEAKQDARITRYARYASVSFVYGLLSKWGTSVWRALYCLAILFCAHVGLTLLLVQSAPWHDCSRFAHAVLRSVNVFLFQTAANATSCFEVGTGVAWFDALFRILAGIQIALLIFALRGRIKRY